MRPKSLQAPPINPHRNGFQLATGCRPERKVGCLFVPVHCASGFHCCSPQPETQNNSNADDHTPYQRNLSYINIVSVFSFVSFQSKTVQGKDKRKSYRSFVLVPSIDWFRLRWTFLSMHRVKRVLLVIHMVLELLVLSCRVIWVLDPRLGFLSVTFANGHDVL